MKKQLLCLLTAFVLLLSGSALAAPALPDFGFFDPLVLQSLTWTEGTGFYDYVMFNYSNTDDPFEEYTVSAVLRDTTPALTMKAGGHTVAVTPLVMCFYDDVVPGLSVTVSDTSLGIAGLVLETENLTLSVRFDPRAAYAGVNEGISYAYVYNMGSNLFTLIGDLADCGGGARCTVTLEDGTALSAACDKAANSEENPFGWLDLCLKECRLIDENRRLQESLRLFAAQSMLRLSSLPEVSLTGAKWIDDLDESITAYPLKLEYAVKGDTALSVGILNYSGAFGNRTRRASATVTLAYYCLDGDNNPLAFADGSVLRHVDMRCALSSGDEYILPVDVPLPRDTVTVMAAISSVTWSDGTVETIPDRDLVFVDYEATVTQPESSPVDEEPVAI